MKCKTCMGWLQAWSGDAFGRGKNNLIEKQEQLKEL